MYKEIFPIRLKSYRKEMGIKQTDIASNTGIPRTSISKYESGKIEPSIESIGKIADYLNVSVDWLIGRGDKK